MLQRRNLLARCLSAGGLALISLLAIYQAPFDVIGRTAAPAVYAQFATVTPTTSLSIDRVSGNDTFVDMLVNLPGVENGFALWGDCDSDGDSDVLLAGQITTTQQVARVYRWQGDFVQAAVLTGVIHGAAAWGDYDNDGWLDIAFTGESTSGPISRLFRNNGSSAPCTFITSSAILSGVKFSTVAWADYDADGQLDLLVAGNNGSQPVTKIYRNNHGSFSDSGLVLPGVQNGSAVWSDYDADGWVDLLLTGATTGNAPLTRLYRNNGSGGLDQIQTALPALRHSAAAWGDYDNDGDPDLLLEGTTASGATIAGIYRNDQGVFVKNTASSLSGGLWTAAAWGDYDTDGYLDALIVKDTIATAYRNEITGSFNMTGVAIGPSLQGGTVAWGNHASNRNLDVLLTGRTVAGPIAGVYTYSPFTFTVNMRPGSPHNLTATVKGSDVILRWSPPITDDRTPLAGLSYNLRVGTQPGGVDVVSPMALTTTGSRLVPTLGNAYSSLSVTLRNLPRGRPLYWSVQAIDTSFVGSFFAGEAVFQIPHLVYLPTTMKNAATYYASEWETEPNNTYLQANGPLESGRIYRGVHNDEKDYFSLYLPVTGTVDVAMSSAIVDTQIQLFYQIADADHRVGFDSSPPYRISYAGAPGWYYIYVYTNPAFAGSQTYTLTVTYP